MTKVSVIGGGNGGCFTALFLSWFEKDLEVELIYNPEIPPERVGQATTLEPPSMLWGSTRFNWYNNPIHATFKSGILYEGFGKYNEKLFHDFPASHMAMHYCPWELQSFILKSGHFKVTESDVLDPNQVDADYVFDCRGRPDDYTDYDELVNPINACLLGKPNWDTTKALWSRHVATPDGWTFVIPTHEESPSHDYCVGYCYNSNITQKEVAEYNFLEMFDVEVNHNINFKNYFAKNPIVDDRIILNGNRLFFLEPLESSSTHTYMRWTRCIRDYIINKNNPEIKEACKQVKKYINQVQNFVLWHYQFGSKYDTPFWDYAKTLTIDDREFDSMLEYVKKVNKHQIIPTSFGGSTNNACLYGQWPAYSFKLWYEGMTKREEK
tara:strand:+ start:47 stop:1189 length:1143 start_codon:yes stop_codon:yes gene_type:complete